MDGWSVEKRAELLREVLQGYAAEGIGLVYWSDVQQRVLDVLSERFKYLRKSFRKTAWREALAHAMVSGV